MINRGKWLLPINKETFKLGATYERSELNETPTEDAEQELLDAMGDIFLTRPAVRVTDHMAGVRPGTKDKQPFVGLHPEHPQLGIFNGFGSKGSLLIPWHAEQFTCHLINGTPLPEQADIRRWHGQSID
jgi:glycine/D-amino acid oxidase-like deaminating enzyme